MTKRKEKEEVVYKGETLEAKEAIKKVEKKVDISKTLVELAKSYVGQKEIAGNQGFQDKEFEKEMKEVGFQKGEAWCATFIKLLLLKAYKEDKKLYEEVKKLASKGAIQTYNNFASSNWITDNYPEEGSIIVWQNYKHGRPHWSGHIGLVSKLTDKNMTVVTIEGNTDSDGDREGDSVLEQTRTLSFNKKLNGLNLLGFIHLKQV